MDIYSSNHICNHSDGEGRYSYRNQPPIGVDAVQKFGNALAEIIGCELEMARNGDAGEGPAGAPKGWAEDTSKLEAWHDEGLKVVEEIASEFMAVHIQEYKRLMSQVGLPQARIAEMQHADCLLDGISETWATGLAAERLHPALHATA